jgi:hypothetical protein
MSTYVTHKNAAVTLGPTLAGGVGAKALRHFYENEFLSTKPPSMRLRLLSRTVGSDRVVDEIYTTFDHTLEMPWMLPGVPATGKRVEVILVAIVALKADKIFTEHLYWDQASVLMQVGLLDPKLVPQGVNGVTKLPVTGRESARRILSEHPARGNEYHQKLVADARAPASSSTSSKPKRPNRQSTSKKPEQRKTQANGVQGGESSKASDKVSDAEKSLNGLSINDKGKKQASSQEEDGIEIANEGSDFADNESDTASPERPAMAARVESEKVE